MGNVITTGNARIETSGNSIKINGRKIPSNFLKKSLFGFSTITSSVFDGETHLKIGKNQIVIKKGGKDIIVNGHSIDGDAEVKQEKRENPKNSKYMISLAEEDTIYKGGIELHRIVALKDIIIDGKVVVKAGDKGGFVESLENLDENGSCWIFNDACVYNDSRVSGKAIVCDEAEIYNKSTVSGNAVVSGKAEVYNNSSVSGNATVTDNAEVYNNSSVSDNVTVRDNAEVYNNSRLTGNVTVSKNAEVHNNSRADDNVRITDNAEVKNAKISGGVIVNKTAVVHDCTLTGNQTISEEYTSEEYKKYSDKVIIKSNGNVIRARNGSICISGSASNNNTIVIGKGGSVTIGDYYGDDEISKD